MQKLIFNSLQLHTGFQLRTVTYGCCFFGYRQMAQFFFVFDFCVFLSSQLNTQTFRRNNIRWRKKNFLLSVLLSWLIISPIYLRIFYYFHRSEKKWCPSFWLISTSHFARSIYQFVCKFPNEVVGCHDPQKVDQPKYFHFVYLKIPEFHLTIKMVVRTYVNNHSRIIPS